MTQRYVVRLPSLDYDSKCRSPIDNKAVHEGKCLVHDTNIGSFKSTYMYPSM